MNMYYFLFVFIHAAIQKKSPITGRLFHLGAFCKIPKENFNIAEVLGKAPKSWVIGTKQGKCNGTVVQRINVAQMAFLMPVNE